MPSSIRRSDPLTLALCALATLLLLSGCDTRQQTPADATPPAATPPGPSEPQTMPQQSPVPASASVQIAPTQGQTASGSLSLTQSDAGVQISGLIEGLKPEAQFGFHVHEKGDCSAPDASSAGAHFNPEDQPHGDPHGAVHHAGDMINIQSDAQGVAQVDTTVGSISLHSGQPSDAIGKSIVVHEKADDYVSQPAGDSGDRIACGVIGAASGAPG
jgi:Cu-Zn family superoxide dismutase